MSKHTTSIALLRRSVLAAALALAGLAGPAQAAENPMGSVGEQHNLYLGCLLKNDPTGQKDPFVILVDVCGFDSGRTSEELREVYTPLLPANPLASMDELIKPYRESLSERQYAFLNETQRILATQDARSAAASLAKLESQAVATLGREKGDLAVLAGLSTARYSLHFWSSGAHPLPASIRPGDVVIADIIGTVVGVIIGGGVDSYGLGSIYSAMAALFEIRK
ncbi:hypothetical protein P2318_24470 [Myxococcaceae bacterium GXIMD 01537]